MRFFRWLASKFNKKKRCARCYRVLTAEEVYYYGNHCERCERKLFDKYHTKA